MLCNGNGFFYPSGLHLLPIASFLPVVQPIGAAPLSSYKANPSELYPHRDVIMLPARMLALHTTCPRTSLVASSSSRCTGATVRGTRVSTLCSREHGRTQHVVRSARLSSQETVDVGFPYTDTFIFNGKEVGGQQLIDMLAPFIFDDRIKRIEAVVKQRTYTVLPIVEGLYDMGNLAAVCRSADAFGMGAVHCINRSEKYKQSARTSAGADKWLDVKVWGNTQECLQAVKAAGYQVVVTHLSKSSITIQEVDWTRPTAFVLGNEKSGVSDEAVAAADHCAIIPMAGFVESFNISVAGALVMYEAQQQRLRKLGYHGDLTAQQQMMLKAALMTRSVREGNTLVQELINRPPPAWQASKFKPKSSEVGLAAPAAE